MSRNTITAIWVGGVLLTVIVYLTGPDRFVDSAFDIIQRGWWDLQDALRNISIAAFDLVRAAAIGLYFVFVALAVLAIRNNGRGAGTLIAVSLLFLGLVWHSSGESFGAHSRWMGALLLNTLAALAMTRRVTQPEPTAWRPGAIPPRPGP